MAPTDAELKAAVKRLVPKVDLQSTGIKAFTKQLAEELGGVDLKSRAKLIKAALSEAINELDDSDDSEEESESESEEEEEVKKPPKKKAKKAATAGTGAPKGLAVKKEISTKLANFLKQGDEMARTEIVKALWEYIKEHDLQNPENRREIILDDAMKEVFDCDRFTMFTMNKYVAAHIHPFKEVDLTPSTKTSPKKRKRKKTKVDPLADKKKRKPKKPGLQPPYKLSSAMAKVAGKKVLPRPQVVTALWAYIKGNNLQNPDDKREIICDANLKAIMGGKAKVTMFNMNRYITEHLLEKLDRSAYTHEDDEGADVDEQSEEEEQDDDDESGDSI